MIPTPPQARPPRLPAHALGVTIMLALSAAAVLLGSRREEPAIEVELASVERLQVRQSILASGTLAFRGQVQLRPEVTGRVLEVRVAEGDRVVQGDMLLRLDPEPFEADLESARALVTSASIDIRGKEEALRLAQLRHRRLLGLAAKGLIAQAQADETESEQRIAEIAVESARQSLRRAHAQQALAEDRLSRTQFLAPIDGVVVAVDIRSGETVVAGTTNILGSSLLTIADPAQVIVEARVDEADILAVGIGQQVEVFPASHPDTPLLGRITHIAAEARNMSGGMSMAFRVLAELNAPDQAALHAGVSCRVEIFGPEASPALAVPVSALQSEAEGAYVWRVGADGRAEKVIVSAGTANDLHQAVDGPLSEGDSIVSGPSRALSGLRNGRLVKRRATP